MAEEDDGDLSVPVSLPPSSGRPVGVWVLVPWLSPGLLVRVSLPSPKEGVAVGKSGVPSLLVAVPDVMWPVRSTELVVDSAPLPGVAVALSVPAPRLPVRDGTGRPSPGNFEMPVLKLV